MNVTILQELRRTSKQCSDNIRSILSKSVTDQELRRICLEAICDIHPRIIPFLVNQSLSILYEDQKKYQMEKIAASIELFKAAALVNDDILDQSKSRNAMPSIYVKYGVAKATLVSSELFRVGTFSTLEITSHLNGKKINKVTKDISEALSDVFTGQFHDVIYEDVDIISEKTYLKMVERTTASLIKLPLVISASLFTQNRIIANVLNDYGNFLGIAYQVRDDIIDIIGNEKIIGKPICTDIKMAKKRLPLLILLQKLSRNEKNRVLRLLKNRPLKKIHVDQILDLIYEYDIIETCKERCRFYTEKSIKSISKLPDSDGRNNLIQIANIISSF